MPSYPDRTTQLARWNQLTRVTLPGMAAAQRWPIRLDHCFMRVCLDHAVGARWDTRVARPATKTLTDAQLAAAIAVAERIAATPRLLPSLNAASLAMRGHATRPPAQTSIRRTPAPEATMDGDANHNSTHEAYHTGLRNLHALEQMAIELTERQAERLENYPEMTAKLRQHHAESEIQAKRLEAIMARHGVEPSTLKNTASSVIGNVAAALHAATQDEVLKNTFANFAFEHQEIAAYTSLIAMAEAVGDTEAVAPLKQSMGEEQAMADWIGANIVPTTQRYLTLLQSGQKSGV